MTDEKLWAIESMLNAEACIDGPVRTEELLLKMQIRSLVNEVKRLSALLRLHPGCAFSCDDCGTPLNEGEAKTFAVCDACWDTAHGKPLVTNYG